MTTAALPPTSRYAAVEVALYVLPDGRTRAYLRRRLLPPPDRLGLLTEYVVTSGDRLDRIAATFLGDPEQFWRVCDANGAMRPEELTEFPGTRIRITLPQGIPG